MSVTQLAIPVLEVKFVLNFNFALIMNVVELHFTSMLLKMQLPVICTWSCFGLEIISKPNNINK